MMEATIDRAAILTPERLAGGMPYAAFRDRMTVKQDVIAAWQETVRIDPADLAAFVAAQQAAGGPVTILVLAEDWCGDVCRELPVVATLAEQAGATLRIFWRSDHPDLTDLYIREDGHRAIPVFAIFANDGRELGHLIERAPATTAAIQNITAELAHLDRPERLTALTDRLRPIYPGTLSGETVRALTAIIENNS